MERAGCIQMIYPELEETIVVTIMGACAQELYDLGDRDNFFYLQHAMGLASSIGLGLAMHLPNERVIVLDGDGSVLMNLGTDAVEPFVRPSWSFMAYGCVAAWQGVPSARRNFLDRYCAIVYPRMAGEMRSALDSLAASIATLTAVLGKNTSNLPGGTIIESWSNPFSSYYLDNSRGHQTELRAVRRQSEEAETQLVLALGKAGREDSAFIRSLLVSAQLVHYTASRFLWAVVICDRWNEAMLGKKKNDFVYYDIGYICHGYIQDMMDEAGELKDAYSAAWHSESQPYRLNTMLGRWNVEYGLWQKLLLKMLDYRIQHDRSYVATGSFEELFNPNF